MMGAEGEMPERMGRRAERRVREERKLREQKRSEKRAMVK